MSKKSLVVDAWIKEAQEAAKLVEDLEARIINYYKNNHNPVVEQHQHQKRLKLLQIGVKLDRLESLLHNPPSKPILTKEDLECRWKMLSDMQQRTRALVLSLYASPSQTRCLDAKETCSSADYYEQDQTKHSLVQYDPEMLEPLVSNDSTQSQKQMRKWGLNLLLKACWILGIALGTGAFLCLLVIICAVL
ncbi:hypothetical protein ACFE04_028691 [Oxalis oulophora]